MSSAQVRSWKCYWAPLWVSVPPGDVPRGLSHSWLRRAYPNSDVSVNSHGDSDANADPHIDACPYSHYLIWARRRYHRPIGRPGVGR